MRVLCKVRLRVLLGEDAQQWVNIKGVESAVAGKRRQGVADLEVAFLLACGGGWIHK